MTTPRLVAFIALMKTRLLARNHCEVRPCNPSEMVVVTLTLHVC
jgi:hypothetical protein